MTDDLERRLQAGLDGALPAAPASTREWLERLPVDHPRVRPGRNARPAAATAAAVAVLAIGIVALLSIGSLVGLTASDASQPVAPPSVGALASSTAAPASPTGPPPSPSPDPLSGLTIHTVSEILDLLARDEVGNQSVAVRGFWTDRSIGHSCTAPTSPPGELQIRCHDGEFGITERNEPIGTLTVDSRFLPPEGPALTPFVDEALAEPLFTLPYIHGQPYPPVPIVVIGHFDDPRTADCQPEARQLCRDRLVIDQIVEFEPQAIPTPGISPSPSPFPFDDPPAARFSRADCAGDVPYTFVGWGYLADYGVDIAKDQVVFLMVTRDKVKLHGSGKAARFVCFAYEWETGSFAAISIP